MQITFTPQARLSPLHYAWSGDVLTVNGSAFDFSQLADGDRLPLVAVSGDWLQSDIVREDGEIRFRAAEANTEEEPEPAEPGVIDWSMLETESSRTAAALAAWRSGASLTVLDFAVNAMKAGHLSEADAEAWVTRQAVPGVVQAALAQLPEEQRPEARLRIMGTPSVHRMNPLVALIAAHMGLSAEQVDALFTEVPA
ncbi:hypothetical protein [Rubellimicrobium arenae]|uniref:hypothetical protein n=1 Tax=Rubellimicrobium arenae TaxID=2817372 RepID=UPI001B312025|nr:hypothetical protein [Rubellimicrobium arenae]